MTTMKHWDTERVGKEWGRLPLQDLLGATSSGLMVQETLANFALKASAREPSILISRLLNEVTLNPATPLLKFPVEEAVIAGSTAEGSESLEVDYVSQVGFLASMEKASVTLRATHEQMLSDSQGILRMLSELAGRALARKKERRVLDVILSDATTVLDNSSANVKSSTGRDATGLRNGTLTISDVVKMVEELLDLGHVANTFICNPRSALSWWLQPSWREWWGEAIAPWQQEGVGNLSRATVVVPRGMPSPWKICLSMYVPEGSLIIASHEYLGELLIDYPIRHQGWSDPARDISRQKYSESYGVNINPAAAVLAKNINITQAYDFGESINLSLTGLVDGLTGDSSFSGVVS